MGAKDEEVPRRKPTAAEIELLIENALVGGSIPDDHCQQIAIRSWEQEARTRARLRKVILGELSLEDALSEITEEYKGAPNEARD